MNTAQRITKAASEGRDLPLYTRGYSTREEEFLVGMARNARTAGKLLQSFEEIEAQGMRLDRFHTELRWAAERTLRLRRYH